jgi:hypothetical protein
MTPLPPKRTPFTWAEWLIYGALALWVLLLAPSVIWGWPAIWGLLQHDNAPAWAQAIGSVVAIGIAIWVPWRQREHGLRDARVAALSLASYVVATVRLARRESAYINPHVAEAAIVHLEVAARLWTNVRLDAMPFQTIPSFVALIALTDEAVALARLQESEPIKIIQAGRAWDHICDRAYGHIKKIHGGRPVVLPELANGETGV